MKGILINPFDETIKEVVVTNDYKDIYLLIECSTFDVVMLNEQEDLFIDDEGLCKNPSRYFKINDYEYAGKGLILSHNEEGDTMSTLLSIKDVEGIVTFLPEGFQKEPYVEFKVLQ